MRDCDEACAPCVRGMTECLASRRVLAIGALVLIDGKLPRRYTLSL